MPCLGRSGNSAIVISAWAGSHIGVAGSQKRAGEAEGIRLLRARMGAVVDLRHLSHRQLRITLCGRKPLVSE